MHYSNLVIIKKTDDVEAAVKQAMGAPEGQGGFWDWYQIGGRWTGALDGYDPETDPANLKTCTLCGGSDDRKAEWKAEMKGCNGCHGTGKQVEWPTQWKMRAGDIQPIESLTQEQLDKFFRIVTPWARTFGGEEYLPWKPSGEMFRERETPPLDWLKKEYPGYLVVVVDNHS